MNCVKSCLLLDRLTPSGQTTYRDTLSVSWASCGRSGIYVLLTLICVSFLGSALGQTTTGVPPFSTIHAGLYDDVKVNDGAILLNLPVWSKPGLIPLSYSLVFNNAVSVNSIELVQLGSWLPQTKVGLSRGLYWSASNKQLTCGSKGNTEQFYNFQITDGYGTVHRVGAIQYDTLQCYSTILSGATSDGSGLTLVVNNPFNGGSGGTIYDRRGNSFSGSGAAPNVLTDVNGNQLSYTGVNSITYTDTMGLNPVSESLTYANGQPTQDVHTWTDPSGNSQSFTIHYSSYTWKTAFGCYIPADISGVSQNFPSSITTPEGTYTISYESQASGTVTGRISKIIFPSGASVKYAYTGGNNGLKCQMATSNGPSYNIMVPVLTRTLTDVNGNVRIWKYDTTQANNETVVTDPAGNDTVYLFYTPTTPTGVSRGFYETQRQIYQGSHTSGSLLKTVLTCYNGNTTNCANPASGTVYAPITQKDVYTTLAGMSQSALSETKYDGFGNLTEGKEYDFSGSLISDRVLLYGTYSNGSCNQIGTYISDRVCSDTTTDSGGHVLEQAYYTYDSRGNRTQTSMLASGAGNGTGQYINTSATYNQNGTVQYSYDTKQNRTSYTYGDCNSTMLTEVQEPMGLSKSMVWNCAGGVSTSLKDENSQVTNYKYIGGGVADPFWRLLETDYPDGGETSVTYNDTANPPNVVMSQLISSSGTTKTTQTNLDGLGNTTETLLTSDPQNTTYTVKVYDPLERLGTSYNPTRCNPPTTQCSETTWGYATYSYDALGRVTQITQPDGSKVTTTYSGNCTTVTDEARNTRESCSDALGRVTGVWEDPGNLNYETDYSYDGLGNLLTVTQKGGASSGNWRVRTFQYDALSRLTSATNPESGNITYAYSLTGNALCSGDPKAVCSKTGPSPNQPVGGSKQVVTSYTYDALNRLTGKSYVDGYGNPQTASASYGYDGVPLTGCNTPSLTDPYPKARRTAMCDGSGATSWSHDPMGRIANEGRTIDGQTQTTKYAYYLDGSLNTLTYPGTGNVITYTVGKAGRPLSATDSVNNYAQGALYAPHGELASMSNGASISVSNDYNDRLQPILLSATGASGNVFSLCFDFHLGIAVNTGPCSFSKSTLGDNGNVYQIVNNRSGYSGRSQSFLYDSLNRVWQAYSSDSTWGETFSPNVYAAGTAFVSSALGIDAWGNLTNRSGVTGKTHGEILSVTANTNNQLGGFTYDTAGNIHYDGSTTYNYDDENRLVSVNGYNYYYDGDGSRVAKSNGSTGTLYWRGPTRDPISESSLMGTTQEEYVFFNNTRIARRDVPSGAVHYYFSDHLGSHGVVENSTGSSCEQDIDYYPYGGAINDYCAVVAQHYRFTGKERDSETGLDNFGARYDASSLGRFMSADPGGITPKHLSDPQGLNRYVYTRNNPLRYVDPNGKDWETAWNDAKTFAKSVYTKWTFGGGLGGEAKVGSGKVTAEASSTATITFRGPDNGGITFSRTTEAKATAEPAGGGAEVGVAVGVTQVDARINSGGVITGQEPSQPVEVSPSNAAGPVDVDISKEDVGFEDVPCAVICAGMGAGATREGWNALGDAISNVKDEVVLPTPPPPPTPAPPPPCEKGHGDTCPQ